MPVWLALQRDFYVVQRRICAVPALESDAFSSLMSVMRRTKWAELDLQKFYSTASGGVPGLQLGNRSGLAISFRHTIFDDFAASKAYFLRERVITRLRDEGFSDDAKERLYLWRVTARSRTHALRKMMTWGVAGYSVDCLASSVLEAPDASSPGRLSVINSPIGPNERW